MSHIRPPRFVRVLLHHRGFTAIELMVVVAIIAILTALALPSFSETVERYRVRQGVEDLTATIFNARAEAIRRGGGVVLAPAKSGNCAPADASDWSCGWTMFFDANHNGVQDTAEPSIRTTSPGGLSAKRTLPGPLRFSRWGDVSGSGSGVLMWPRAQKVAQPQSSTVICLSSAGRIDVWPGALTCPGAGP